MSISDISDTSNFYSPQDPDMSSITRVLSELRKALKKRINEEEEPEDREGQLEELDKSLMLVFKVISDGIRCNKTIVEQEQALLRLVESKGFDWEFAYSDLLNLKTIMNRIMIELYMIKNDMMWLQKYDSNSSGVAV